MVTVYSYFILFQAGELVHEDNAKYPKKIIYNYTTPHLAVEALEVSFLTDISYNVIYLYTLLST